MHWGWAATHPASLPLPHPQQQAAQGTRHTQRGREEVRYRVKEIVIQLFSGLKCIRKYKVMCGFHNYNPIFSSIKKNNYYLSISNIYQGKLMFLHIFHFVVIVKFYFLLWKIQLKVILRRLLGFTFFRINLIPFLTTENFTVKNVKFTLVKKNRISRVPKKIQS